MSKRFIEANHLLNQSYQLAVDIINSGFNPNFIVALWRGGTPIGIAIQELMEYVGISTDHIAIRTSSYRGINQMDKKVRVHSLGYLIDNVKVSDRLLVVDDVFDTGRSMQAVLARIEKKSRNNMPQQIRIATPYYKPSRNQTELKPDYYLEETEEWLVFPHELCGIDREQVIQNRPQMKVIFDQIKTDKLPL